MGLTRRTTNALQANGRCRRISFDVPALVWVRMYFTVEWADGTRLLPAHKVNAVLPVCDTFYLNYRPSDSTFDIDAKWNVCATLRIFVVFSVAPWIPRWISLDAMLGMRYQYQECRATLNSTQPVTQSHSHSLSNLWRPKYIFYIFFAFLFLFLFSASFLLWSLRLFPLPIPRIRLDAVATIRYVSMEIAMRLHWMVEN